MSAFCLRFLNGPCVGRRILLQPHQKLTVGRNETADLALPYDAMLSERHFRVSRPGPRLFQIEDMGSTNGTFVNGKLKIFSRLAAGDIITAGMTVLLVAEVSQHCDAFDDDTTTTTLNDRTRLSRPVTPHISLAREIHA